jgi:tryptophan-rich sensory protein
MQEDTICIRAGKIILKTPPVSYKRDSLRLGISIAAPLIAGVIGSIFTSESVSTWYQTIEKPSFSPPNWLFGPVWTTLYVLMGISLFLIWRATSTATFPTARRNRKIAAFIAFGSQLILNVLWSFIFFGLRSPQLAFAEIVILLISIMVTIVIFYKISRLAAVLMMPYAGWVTFASFLNLQIWLLNFS